MKRPRHYETTEKKLLQCLQAEPRNPEHYLKLGKSYFLKADYDRATEIYHRGLSVAPQNIRLLFNLAVTEEAEQRTKNAKEIYLKILTLSPNYKPAQIRLEKLTAF